MTFITFHIVNSIFTALQYKQIKGNVIIRRYCQADTTTFEPLKNIIKRFNSAVLIRLGRKTYSLLNKFSNFFVKRLISFSYFISRFRKVCSKRTLARVTFRAEKFENLRLQYVVVSSGAAFWSLFAAKK